MKIIRFFLVLVTLCLFTITGLSSTNKEQITITANSLSAGAFDPNSKEDRVAIAKMLLEEINALDSYIPAPSPDDI